MGHGTGCWGVAGQHNEARLVYLFLIPRCTLRDQPLNSLSTREINGATMLVEVDTVVMTNLLIVWFIVKVREVVGSLIVRNEVEQPQELAMNATRGRHARGQKRQ